MKVVIDIECNGLINPTKIWCIVCKDIDTNEYYIFREGDYEEKFREFSRKVNVWIGHGLLSYDLPVLRSHGFLTDVDVSTNCIDTLIVSKMLDYSRQGHSIEDYGKEIGLEKISFNDFSKYSKELLEYCQRDVDICHSIYNKYKRHIHKESLQLEQQFQLVVNTLSTNGFYFNKPKAITLLEKVNVELNKLDVEILKVFTPKATLVKEVHPKVTKHGTLSKTDFRFVKDGDLSSYTGDPFSRFVWVPFNPSSHKQVVDVLHAAGWSPVDKTKTHIEYLRNKGLDKDKLIHYNKYGWKVNENNISTLPNTAPLPARHLAKRILLESRRRTLTEWIGLVRDDGRIHGDFQGIGAWTHRMAHQRPNTANIPNDLDTAGHTRLLGRELRSLWCAPKKRLLVGVDAEGIQLRIFAHYIDDPEFTAALVKGRKDDKTDPHSLNQRVLGGVCKSRAAAKRFVYALLLGAGIKKLTEILECSEDEAQDALDRLLERYQGFGYLKKTLIPHDAKRGFFTGLDGRHVPIPGDTSGERRHLCMSGYLQNGEAIIMKRATLKWHDNLKEHQSLLVDMVHDEWQTETPNNMEVALLVAKAQSDSLFETGEELKLHCPLAGSYWNEDHKDYTIGVNWYQTH